MSDSSIDAIDDLDIIENNAIIDRCLFINKDLVINGHVRIIFRGYGCISLGENVKLYIDGGEIILSENQDVLFLFSGKSIVSLRNVKIIGSGYNSFFNLNNDANILFAMKDCLLKNADCFDLSGAKIGLDVDKNIFESSTVLTCSENGPSIFDGNTFKSWVIFRGIRRCVFYYNIIENKNTSVVFTDNCEESSFISNSFDVGVFVTKGKIIKTAFTNNYFHSNSIIITSSMQNYYECHFSGNTFGARKANSVKDFPSEKRKVLTGVVTKSARKNTVS